MTNTPSYFDRLSLSRVTLRTRGPEALSDFYLRGLGFHPTGREDGRVELAPAGAPEALLVLVPAPEARQRARDEAGLFHVAFLHPSRASLGRAIRRLIDNGIPFGAGDHGVSEAIYFSDPEGNGIELYADRAPALWPRASSGELAMDTGEVDVASLLAEAERHPATDGTLGVRIGHLHLAVSDLAKAGAFYQEVLGLEVMQGSLPGALFLGRDGYHHHLGLNRWRSRRHASDDSQGLAEFSVRLAGHTPSVERSDPDGIHLRVLADE